MIKLNINVTKVDKTKLFKGAKGTYLGCVLKDRPDEYGNDGFITMDTTKEEREAGVRGEIIGTWKHVGAKPAAQPAQATKRPMPQRPTADPDLDTESEEIPF